MNEDKKPAPAKTEEQEDDLYELAKAMGVAAIIALVGSLLGASYPAIKAAQKDPIDALAYE